MHRRLLAVVLIAFAFTSVLCSQAQQTSDSGHGVPALSAVQHPPSSYTLPPDKLKQAEALYHTRVVMLVVGTIYGFVVLIAILGFRVAPRLRDWVERITRRRFLQAALFVPAIFILIDVLEMPESIYGHHLSLRYGLSVQRWGSWFWDWTKGEMVGIVIATLIVWMMYAIIRRSAERWWLYFWLATLPIIFVAIFLAPVVLDPMFNRFTPLDKSEPTLVTAIERVTQRGGLDIPRDRMFEMAASEKVTTYNAYVTGIGATKRVVVWDNTAHDLSTGETLFIFGHEMGHYVLNHIYKGLAFAAVLMFFGFYIAYRLVRWATARWGQRLQVRDAGDWASLPVLLLIAAVIGFFGQPIGAAFSRHVEHQADIYGLEVTHGIVPDNNDVAAMSFQRLGEKGLSYPSPNPLLVLWTYDHPPISDRYQFALSYRPWDTGREKYVK